DFIANFNLINKRIRNEAAGTTTGVHAGIHVHTNFVDSMKALDNAKHSCRNIGDDMNIRYRFYSDTEKDHYLRQRYIVENFKNAMDSGWFKIFYQCFLRLETGKGYGFEALARWVDPEIGVIPPSQFIPALEKYHLMHELDLYMFEQVCREIKPRYDSGLPLLPVSVNFSRQDFDYIDVPAELNKIVDHYNIGQYGIDRSYFIIEITEQDMATATEKFYRQLAEIRESGFQLWIDDFGSGYSSLNVFGRFEIDLIKFDMELLRNLDSHNGANREIIKAMIQVAKKLGVHTLCEGMETEDQKQFLIDAGCELAQGYLYHKPEPLAEIFTRLDLGIPIPPNETEEERIALEKKWKE
ncbi:MAG: EAL domain-containing protein, partial [Lachnospiraceae bacterium]|nr:EAL domain-containing protein [Lachnospiraceae bacterium]